MGLVCLGESTMENIENSNFDEADLNAAAEKRGRTKNIATGTRILQADFSWQIPVL
jgi:hypothetical protein